MARDNGAGAGSVMLAFLMGAVAGAAVALLYAPAPGSETREFLGERVREGKDRAAEAAAKGRDIVNQGREMVNQGRETVATAIERGREAYQQARVVVDGKRQRVSGWSEVFLGIIALATLAMALMQIGILVAAGLLARRVNRLVTEVEAEMKPIFAHLNSIGRDASRAAALATMQVERVDRMFADVAERVEGTLNTVQASLAIPAGEARAIFGALRAAFLVLRDRRGARRRRPRGDDEDALFI